MIRIIASLVSQDRRGIYFSAALEDGTQLCQATRQPIFDGARALIARGYDPETKVTLRYVRSETDSFLPVSLKKAARFAATEDENGTRFRKHRPAMENGPLAAISTSDDN